MTPIGALKSTLWKGMGTPGEWVALMGWLDAGANPVSTAAWFAAIGVVVLAVLHMTSWRAAAASGLAMLALAVVWLVLDNVITRSGSVPFWQARYGAPLVAVALICLVAGWRWTARSPTIRLRVLAVPAFLIGLTFFASATRMVIRYGWGASWDGPWYEPLWLPMGNRGWLTVFVLVAMAVAVAILVVTPWIVSRYFPDDDVEAVLSTDQDNQEEPPERGPEGVESTI